MTNIVYNKLTIVMPDDNAWIKKKYKAYLKGSLEDRQILRWVLFASNRPSKWHAPYLTHIINEMGFNVRVYRKYAHNKDWPFEYYFVASNEDDFLQLLVIMS